MTTNRVDDRPSFGAACVLAALWCVALFWLPLGLLVWWWLS